VAIDQQAEAGLLGRLGKPERSSSQVSTWGRDDVENRCGEVTYSRIEVDGGKRLLAIGGRT